MDDFDPFSLTRPSAVAIWGQEFMDSVFARLAKKVHEDPPLVSETEGEDDRE